MNLKNIGTKYLLAFLTFTPVLFVSLLFFIYHAIQFNGELKQQTTNLGEAYIRQLMPAAQVALLRQDNHSLQHLAESSTVNPEIQSVSFYSRRGDLLAHRGETFAFHRSFIAPKLSQANNDHAIIGEMLNPYTYHFVSPIFSPTHTSNPRLAVRSAVQIDDILGWVAIDVDSKLMLIKRYQMHLITIGITIAGVLMSLFFYWLIGRYLYRPIGRLRRSMKQILRNEFETQIKVVSHGELGLIEQGCAYLQKQYSNMTQELSQSIDVATADLQQSLELLEEKNIELSFDKKKAEEKSRLKSEFIANMSHEVRTPMNGVIGFTNVLLESKLDPLQLDYVKTIKASAQDLLTIINDILDYSKMEAGKLHLDVIPLDIRSCIDEVLALNSPHANKKGLDLIPATNPNVPLKMLGDPVRVKQLLSNLVTNAIKFTDHGYIHIRTQIEQVYEKEYGLCISITDTGVGISADDQAVLFNAFAQVDSPVTHRQGGFGLGLVICKKLAEQMQGRITLSSEPQKGTTFTIHIKLAKLAAYEIEKHEQHRFAHLNVLCFDDNPLHMEGLCHGLGTWGVQCTQINTLSLLEEAFQQHPECKLAFISVNQGCEMQIADIIRQQTIPCVLISKWYIPNYQELGAQALLFKPAHLQKLHDTIDEILMQASQIKPRDSALEQLRETFKQLKPELLIAEDNPTNRLLLQSLLQHATIVNAHDGQEAVAQARQQRFQAILLDLQMPRLNGFEAAQAIHQTALLNKNTPIYLISASHNHFNAQELQSAGIVHCLAKPIDEKHLLQSLIQGIQQSPNKAINWTLCVEKVSGNQALAAEFLAHFMEELEKNRTEFLVLIDNNNLPGIEQLAHKLHGACCFCGVTQLQHHVAQVETQTKQALHVDELSPILTMMLESIKAALEEYEQEYRQRLTFIEQEIE